MTLDTIMTGLEALTPTYDSDVTVRVWAYDDLKDELSEDSCPVRMIGLNDDKQGALLEVNNLNNKDRAVWDILDRLYIFPVALGKGLTPNNRHILVYMDSYMSQISANKCMGGGKVVEVDFSPPYQRDYPEGTDMWFWVVDALVTVEEYR